MLEKLTFKFLLTIIAPCSLKLTAGNESVEKNFDTIGKESISVTFETVVDESYTVALETKHNGIVALIDNVEVVWHDDEKITPVWRVPGENEVWDYIDADATKRARAFETSPALRTMSLDYLVDTHLNGFLNNFARFVDSEGNVATLVDNGNKLFPLNRPGKFTFRFKAPIAYWCFKRLFVKPQTQG